MVVLAVGLVLPLVLAATGAVARSGPAVAQSGPAVAQSGLAAAGSARLEAVALRWAERTAGASVAYDATGAASARQDLVAGEIDLALTEVALDADEADALADDGAAAVHLPVVASGVAVVANLPDDLLADGVRLGPEALVGIFTGAITDWSDPAIAADNGGVTLPDLAVRPVVRGDSAWESVTLSSYAIDRVPEVWADFAAATGVVDDEPVSVWPLFGGTTPVDGDGGVLDAVSRLPEGAIGYAEADLGLTEQLEASGLGLVELRNEAGRIVSPTADALARGLGAIVAEPGVPLDLAEAFAAPDAAAYPLVGVSYLVARDDVDDGVGEDVAAYAAAAVCDGQQDVRDDGFAELPDGLVRVALDGAALLPGAEDLDGNGAIDDGETDPNDPSDDFGGGTTTTDSDGDGLLSAAELRPSCWGGEGGGGEG